MPSRTFEEVARAQGWNTETQLSLLFQYIANQQDDNALNDFAEQIASEENVIELIDVHPQLFSRIEQLRDCFCGRLTYSDDTQWFENINQVLSEICSITGLDFEPVRFP